jgi:phosphoribosylformylglycinamidine synthase
VVGVRVGKAMRFTLDAADAAAAQAEVAEMCDRFLTNPVIEDAVITVTEAAGV